MNRKIIVRSDASVKDGWGVGVAFEAIIFDEGGSYEKHSDKRHIAQEMKTNEAEYLASVFGVQQIYHEMNGQKEEYELVVECDHNDTADRINENAADSSLERVLYFYAQDFKEFKAQWIPRAKNQRADAMARTALNRGFEESP